MTTVEFVERICNERGGKISVGLFGIGKGNLALIETLAHVKGCRLVARSDFSVSDIPQGLPLYVGRDAERIEEDVLILSPSARRDRPCFLDAAAKGTIITSECDIFFSDNVGKRFLVSGSDGKSTTAALAGEMLKGAFDKVYPVGNMGIPYSTVQIDEEAAYVCELSSFNLEYISPKGERCILTNITDNHLDWHDGKDGYIRAKMRLYEGTRGAVVPEALVPLAEQWGIEIDTIVSRHTRYQALQESHHARHYVYTEGGWIYADGEKLAPIELINSSIPFALENSLGAIALTLGYATPTGVREALKGFRGLAHRCQVYHGEGGIDYIDSSIDTSPARTAATLNSMGRPMLVILGGRGKGLSPMPLREPLLRYANGIALYGELGQELAEWINSDDELRAIPHADFDRLADAILYLTERARAGDTVILTPAGASYGEFRDFDERGRAFCDTVAIFLNK